MIDEFSLKNCGPIEHVRWDTSPHINLVIGTNGTGKSIILKMLYVAVRSTEEYKRGHNPDSFRQTVNKKLRGTFQLEQVGDLVKKGGDRLKFESKLDDQKIEFSFSPSAVQGVGDVSDLVEPRGELLSFFLPPKEILSLTQIIERTRTVDYLFGFDDTYLDLTRGLNGNPTQGQMYKSLRAARRKLSSLLNGKLERIDKEWVFREGKTKHSIHITAEGIKKLALLDRLIGNRSLSPGSVLFVDEPEAMLHPRAIVEFMEILHLLAKQDIQIFLASHSYFVLKALYIIAQREEQHISVLSLSKDANEPYTITNLSEEMPDNPIIDESIALYERRLDAEMGL